MDNPNSILRQVLSANENDKCLECGSSDATWVSFPCCVVLCPKCAREHKNFVKPQVLKSTEVNEFTEQELKLLSLGGNSRYAALMKEYSISLTEPSLEYKYLTIISNYYCVLLNAEANRAKGLQGSEEKYQEILKKKPIYEIGGEIDNGKSNLFETQGASEHEVPQPKQPEDPITSTVNSWFGYFGGAVKNTMQYMGIDTTISQAKDKISNTISYYGVDKMVKETTEKVTGAAKGAGEFIVAKGKEIGEIPAVKTAVNKVEEGFSTLKEKAGEMVGIPVQSNANQNPNPSHKLSESSEENKNIGERLRSDNINKI